MAHERPIDLERPDRKVVQEAERREAGPEIVDGHPDSHPVQAVQHRGGLLRVTHKLFLSDVEADLLALDSLVLEHAPDLLEESIREELARHDVDTHRRDIGRAKAGPPGVDLLAHLFEHPDP